MREFKIGDRVIGLDTPPFIIAEAGINHNGDYNKAIQLVDSAKENGADSTMLPNPEAHGWRSP